MLHHPHHLLSSAAPLLGVSACLERETKTKQQNTQTPTKQLGVGQSHRTLRSCRRVGGALQPCVACTCAVRGTAAPATLCEPELPCEPELVHFLPLCCFVLLHCWPARPPPSRRQRMRLNSASSYSQNPSLIFSPQAANKLSCLFHVLLDFSSS